ncbi:hypothetical protein NP493_732g02037 [Ridgeia piscesae]|uniref:Ankyrin repeat domain-containing protein n=1 Tax=Ridgeia piscesae TaxID=27915 RepID=A0AAD9KQ16_RIDPI|nr:hypothetical protein NP493_732g02037 [Ridgeia piscesae]
MRPDLRLLQELVNAGCSVNCQNAKGFTPLHRAATRGNVPVINWLLQHGADRNLPNRFGVYPADSATNAGHRDVTPLLSGDNSGRVVDIIQPHTPMRMRLAMQNPEQKLITESLKQLRGVKKKILKVMTP